MADIRITPASSIMSFTSSLNFLEKLTQDASGSLNLYGSGSTGRTELLSVDGNNGRLFTVSDDLSDSLFSVNTIAGLPVIEAFADNTVNIGQYTAPPIKVTGSQAYITGSLNGGSSYSFKSIVYNDNTNATYYPIFAPTANSAPQSLYGDTSNLTYNPFTNILTAGTFSGALSGNATTATTAATASSVSTLTQDVAIQKQGGVFLSLTGQVFGGVELRLLPNSTSGFAKINVGNTNSALDFQMNSATKATLTQNGLFGVGTTNPASGVHVVRDAAGPVGYTNLCAVFGDNTATGSTYTNSVGVAGRVFQTGSRAIYGDASTGGGWAGYFDGKGYFSGNVGIGITAPSFPLSFGTGLGNKVALYDAGSGNGYGFGIQSSLLQIFSNASSDDITFGYGNSAALTRNVTFKGTGNVGIGTTSPGSRLDVSINDNAYSTAVTVRNTNTGSQALSQIVLATASSPNNPFQIRQFNNNGAVEMANYANASTNFWTSGSVRLTITNGGAMGLGLTSPTNTAGRFEASNDIIAYSSSDKNWKTNIKNIDSPLEKISQINGVEFDWIEDEPVHGNKGHDVGVIAQEIELILPEAVQTRESGMKAVKYEKVIPLLIEAIKDQQKQIEELKQIVNDFTE